MYNRSSTDKRQLLEVVQRHADDRRRRCAYFDQDLFGEPAWDILLDLFESELSGRRLTVTGVTHGISTPATTGLRWLKQLEDAHLIARERSHSDRRVCWIKLTDDGYARMARYFLGQQ